MSKAQGSKAKRLPAYQTSSASLRLLLNGTVSLKCVCGIKRAPASLRFGMRSAKGKVALTQDIPYW